MKKAKKERFSSAVYLRVGTDFMSGKRINSLLVIFGNERFVIKIRNEILFIVLLNCYLLSYCMLRPSVVVTGCTVKALVKTVKCLVHRFYCSSNLSIVNELQVGVFTYEKELIA